MPDLEQLAREAVEILASKPHQKTIEIDTPGMTGGDVSRLIDAVYDASAAAGVALKGVKVDPMQLPLPAGAQYVNAYIREGRLIIVDLDLDDMVVVRRK